MSEVSPSPALPPPAKLRRRRISFVWLIPVLAAVIACYLGYRTVLQEGPLVTLTFSTAEGLQAGQTQLKYKAVALGTVDSIDLSTDNQHVVVKLRMNEVGRRFLTSHARFWVVRPRFTPGDLSGLDTLVSGAYIAVDPGVPGGTYQNHFTGLEEPPGVRSNEPGSTYVLRAENIGALGTGSPIFYRDVQVGEVLSDSLGNGLGPVTINVFVRAPFNGLVRPGSRFWNSSGVTAVLQNGDFHIEFQSLAAIISGGITFDVPQDALHNQPSPDGSAFPLYASKQDADAAGYRTNVQLISYFTQSVSGLSRGAPVNILGIQVGQVTDIKLIVDPADGMAKVRVAMTLQPGRVVSARLIADAGLAPDQVLQDMVKNGIRVQLDSGNIVTGEKVITLTKPADAGTLPLTYEDGVLVVPSVPGGLDDALANLTDISAKLDKIPFDQIGKNLNQLLLTANHTIGGPQMKHSLTALDQTLTTAKATMQGVQRDYGADSDVQRNLIQLLAQANAALQSLRQLTQDLDRHPQSLLLGRGGQ
jgi:paraquat-inducible protein B